MRVRLCGVLIGLLGAGMLGFTGQPPAKDAPKPGKQLIVGFSQCGSESSWRTAETASMKKEAQKRGADLKFADAQGKQANQISAIRSFITQRVDVIILAPKVETGWEGVLREAREAKIPVVLVDRGVQVSDKDLYATLIASDFIEEGKMAAEWLAARTGGKANIVELQGETGAAPAIDRQKGFAQEIAKRSDMKIIKSQAADFTAAKGKEVMQAFIKSDKGKFNAVYAHNDDMALGAIQALEEAGMKPGMDVFIVSIDGVKAAFEAMVAGKLNATVECNPLLGPMAFDAIDKIRAGQTVPKFIKQNDSLFDQGNAAAAIKSREY